MSNKKTPVTILEKIKAALKLGEDGKLQSFFLRIEKAIKREIKSLETSLALVTSQHEQKLDALKDSLEDAQTSLDAAYMNVTVEQIATNSLQESFMGTYLEGISETERVIAKINKNITQCSSDFADEVSEIKEQIKERQRIINNLNGIEDSSEDSSAATV